ncbi:hypothetical protein Tco_0280314 [Tanacetum coccineum]
MIIPESDSTHEFANKVDELRALPGHVLGATSIHVLEDDLNDLKWTWEEDGVVETLDPQFLLDIFILDSEDSTVTYTAVSSLFEGLSDIEMPEDPYTYVVAAFQAPPSPDYVLGPEEPEPAPLSPEFFPEPVYSEFMPPVDEVFPAEEQPLPAVVSLTPNSPGYIEYSDPEEDEEDPEQDPTDYPTDRGDDDDDDDKSSDDEEDDDDDVEEDEDKEEEEEYPALADSVPPPVHRVIARMSIREQPPTPFWSESEIARLLALPSPPPSPSPHGYRAAMIQLRAETSSTSHPLPLSTPPLGTPLLLPIPLPTPSPHLLLPSIDCRACVFKVTLPPRKRLCIALGMRYEVDESSSAPTARPTGGFRVDYRFVATLDDEIRRDPERDIGYGITDTWDERLVGMPGAPMTDETELGRRLTDFATTVRQDTDEIYGRLDDAQDDRSLMSGRLNMLFRDRRAHARTALLMEREDILSPDRDCSFVSSRPRSIGTAYRDTETDEYTTNTGDSTTGTAGTR